VGHEQDGDTPVTSQSQDEIFQVLPGLGVDGTERLVHEEQHRIAGDGPDDGRPLLRSAGQLPGAALRGVVQPDGGKRLLGVAAAPGGAGRGWVSRSGTATLSRTPTLSHGYSDPESWNTTASWSGAVPCTAAPFTVIVPWVVGTVVAAGVVHQLTSTPR
jgi:hypothetical protein